MKKLYGVSLDLTRLRVIGCTADVHILFHKQTKLQPKSKHCVQVGYNVEFKAYRCWDLLARHIVTTNVVTFFEHIPGNFVDAHKIVGINKIVDLFSGFDAENDLLDPTLPSGRRLLL